jgi:hypothetical protein
MSCECHSAGYCISRGREVSKLGHRICKSGDPRSVLAYFGDGENSRTVKGVAAGGSKFGTCAYLGGPINDSSGRQLVQNCPTCKGTVKLKVFGCEHPGHVADPTTTSKVCERCRDYATRLPVVGGDPVMNHWRGGV